MSERPPPDFAMLRAVEVLARIARETQTRVPDPAPRLDVPIVLRGPRCTFALGTERREQIERALGAGGAYPVAGWTSWSLAGARGPAVILSAFFHERTLVAVELYRSRRDATPNLPRITDRFRFEPGDIALGNAVRVAPPGFARANGGPGTIVYADAFEVRFPGGVAYVMGNDGVAERLVLYAQT